MGPADRPTSGRRLASRESARAGDLRTVEVRLDRREDASTERDLRSLEPVRVAIAVVVLVMVPDDRQHLPGEVDVLEQPDATFAVNVLRQDQQDLSDRFAWVKDEDRFLLGDWSTAATGAPVLADAAAWLDCTIHSRTAAGTHTIYVGEVQASRVPSPDAPPLVYWDRAYRRLEL